ncbi:MAG: FecR domain-containing protein [Fibrobacteraceae bacterium]|nr:FecR domain-containing protein [Fibrobacteraceae bacterium]
MPFFRGLKIFTLMLVLTAAFTFAAKNEGKVRSRTGEVDFQRGSSAEWKQVRQGMPVKKNDRIRTMIESQVIVGMNDGSTVAIEENSLVEFAELIENNGVNKTVAEVKSGKIRFDIQTQKKNGSSFLFKTGTATAAIRGTSGAVGTTPKASNWWSLENGNMDIDTDGGKLSIEANEIAFERKGKVAKMPFTASVDKDALSKVIQLLDDETKSMEDIQGEIANINKAFEAKIDSLKSISSCKFAELPDTTIVSSITIKGSCVNVDTIEISSEKMNSQNAVEWAAESYWDSENDGLKKFTITCYAAGVAFECGRIQIFYRNPNRPTHEEDNSLLKVNRTDIQVCETGSAVIEGTFDTTDVQATLYVKVGQNVSQNLVPLSADGSFYYPITLTDKSKLWNETSAIVSYNSKNGSKDITVNLNVDKSCKDVNLTKPSISFISYDSLACRASFNLSKIDDDIVILSSYRDGDLLDETTFTSDSKKTFSLKPGIHSYMFTAEDLAGNKSTLIRKLGCFPKSQASLSISKGNHEVFRVPPPPRGISASFTRTLHFKINNVPYHDPAQIKSISVVNTRNGSKTFLQGNHQITDLDYDIPIDLERNTKTTVEIKVVMKNGKILTATKTYEVR